MQQLQLLLLALLLRLVLQQQLQAATPQYGIGAGLGIRGPRRRGPGRRVVQQQLLLLLRGLPGGDEAPLLLLLPLLVRHRHQGIACGHAWGVPRQLLKGRHSAPHSLRLICLLGTRRLMARRAGTGAKPATRDGVRGELLLLLRLLPRQEAGSRGEGLQPCGGTLRPGRGRGGGGLVVRGGTVVAGQRRRPWAELALLVLLLVSLLQAFQLVQLLARRKKLLQARSLRQASRVPPVAADATLMQPVRRGAQRAHVARVPLRRAGERLHVKGVSSALSLSTGTLGRVGPVLDCLACALHPRWAPIPP